MNTILDDLQPYLDLLNELCSLGTPMRKILVDYMINEEFYKEKISAELRDTQEDNVIHMDHSGDFPKEKSNRNYKHCIYENSLKKQRKIKGKCWYKKLSF